ncbi:hypothetical protein V5799_026035 [Amblyomma americanum]|uniref:Uncharacterized protein n=1 Tax=Amblyomma americanum TaxID=6943 RepID=A0AAQ4DJQ7_AMBAM
MIPEDGLCDYLFYDSIFKDNRNVLVNPKGFENDMKIFAGNYRKFKKTAFGIGFAFKKAHILKENLRAAGPLRLEYFWSRGIYHFGILDTPTLRLSQSEVEVAFECLKLCKVQALQAAKHFGIVAFDLDYEDFSNYCPTWNKYGNFSRLRTLRRILDFFRTEFKTEEDEDACLRLVS